MVLFLFMQSTARIRRKNMLESIAERSIIMEVRNVNGHYEIYLDGAFVCSCDANELREVVEEMGE